MVTKKEAPPKTHLCMILDRSGSMFSIAQQTVDHFNETVQMIQDKAAEGQDIVCTLVTFNHDVYLHFFGKPTSELALATVEGYKPGGETALRDAIGFALRRLRENEDEGTAYLVKVISDGEENASRHCSAESLKEQIQSCEANGRWTFTYLGCDRSSVDQAVKIGFSHQNVAHGNLRSKVASVGTYAVTNSCDSEYFNKRLQGQMKVQSFYSAPIGNSGGLANDLDAAQVKMADMLQDRQAAKARRGAPRETGDVFGKSTRADWKPED